MMGLISMLLSVAHGAPEITLSANPRAVMGQTIQVKITASNPDSNIQPFPDIANRPWLVRFETTDPNGVRRQLYSTPPEIDPPTEWSLSPGERREVLFDVPTSESWTTGYATVAVIVANERLPMTRFELFDFQPDHSDTQAIPVDQVQRTSPMLHTILRNGTTEIWVEHRGRTELLTVINEVIQPELSVARSDRNIGRWITWTDKNSRLWAVQTRVRDIQREPFIIHLPWPRSYPCGRAATDARARLVVPICFGSPSGETVQLIAAIISGTKTPKIRSVARFKPSKILTNVDAAGNVDFILVRPKSVDIATIEAEQDHERPSTIKRLWRGDATIARSQLQMTPLGPAVALTMDSESVEVIQLTGTP
jgi:hypothetical protein